MSDDLVEMTRKPIYFDIPVYAYSPEACERAVKNMRRQLDVTYNRRYIFTHEESLPPFDGRGNSLTTRRHYLVDIFAK